ncbi:MAG: trypsin-like peptidase domain-containing protein [Acidobacteriota bacterium]|nr:trypsin-like peptidase domain-containing protein [Acidobacteriota bacterium]
MERMVIKHLSGSKANQVEEFALKYHNEIILGRDTSATVQYDPNRDDLVGRQHAKITKDPNDQYGFLLTDLNSTNGTFHNKQRVTGTVRLSPGDYVQLGPSGPEFQFDAEPRPMSGAKQTRMADFGNATTPATRMVGTSGGAGGKPPGTVGKATVERMISQTVTETKKAQGRKYGLIAAVAAVSVLLLFGVLIGGAYWYSNHRESALKEDFESKTGAMEKKIADDKSSAPISAADINDKYGKSVVYIEVAWRLIDTQKQAQIYHQFVPNSREFLSRIMGVNYGKGAIDQTAGNAIPLYIQVGNSYEPILTDEKNALSVPIGGRHTGTGFVVTSDGFVLTNRHVAATWMTTYHFPPDTPRGIVITPSGQLASTSLMPPPTDWVPANTKQEGKQLQGTLKGVDDTLDVTLAGKESRMAAQLKQTSDRHDVALIKIDVPGQLTKVELYDNYDTLKKGEQVTIMGYPAASPPVYGVIKSNDVFNQGTQAKLIPDPTVTTTNIGNIIRSNDDEKDKRVSLMGDVIQLATGSTGAGNSGGPVFDSQGRVIGIFFAGQQADAITYAVPIRYGKEFLASE